MEDFILLLNMYMLSWAVVSLSNPLTLYFLPITFFCFPLANFLGCIQACIYICVYKKKNLGSIYERKHPVCLSESSLFSFVYILYMCVLYVWRSEIIHVFLNAFLYFVLRPSFIKAGMHRLGQIGWLVSSSDLPVFLNPSPSNSRCYYRQVSLCLIIYVGSQYSNTGSCVYTTDTLLIEPSSNPCLLVCTVESNSSYVYKLHFDMNSSFNQHLAVMNSRILWYFCF